MESRTLKSLQKFLKIRLAFPEKWNIVPIEATPTDKKERKRMKIYIFADLEGISGVSNSEYINGSAHFVELGRKFMAEDINSCIAGCFDAGATEVIVRDGHGSGVSVLWDQLIPGVELIQGGSPGKDSVYAPEVTV